MPTARARLAEFIADRELSQAQAAALLGCSQGLVSKILRGDRIPGLALALAIERESASWAGGPIAAAEWVPTAESASLDPTGT